MAKWYSAGSPEEQNRLLGAWPDAPIENLEVCGSILNTARDQVLEYGRTIEQELVIEDGIVVDIVNLPERYVLAQLQQAKNLWNAGTVSSAGDVGVEQFSYTPRPLDKTIKGIIRPQAGGPRVR